MDPRRLVDDERTAHLHDQHRARAGRHLRARSAQSQLAQPARDPLLPRTGCADPGPLSAAVVPFRFFQRPRTHLGDRVAGALLRVGRRHSLPDRLGPLQEAGLSRRRESDRANHHRPPPRAHRSGEGALHGVLHRRSGGRPDPADHRYLPAWFRRLRQAHAALRRVAMKPVVEVSNLRKRFRLPLDRSTTLKYRVTHWRSASRYRDLIALHDISFDVPAGQFLGVAGPNGCGKSTLLKILCRIYEADSGYARVNGEFSAFLELGVGFNPELTARENVFLGGAMLGLTRAQLRDKIDEVFAFAELEDFAEQKLKNFSSGMQVRLAFSVAILAETDLLVMDEVLAVGDASFQEKCFDTFSRYKREGKTIVLVSHDLGALEEYCDRVLLLNRGEIIADGPAAEVTSTYHRMIADHALAAERDMPQELRRADPTQWGSRAVELVSVSLLDAGDRKSTRFDTGGAMTLDMHLLAHSDVGDFVCGLAIRRADGMLLAGTNTFLDHVTVTSHSPGESISIRYAIESLPLLAGGYIIQVVLQDVTGSHRYDFADPAASFHINNMGGHIGIVEMHGRWQVAQEQDVRSGAITQTAG